ncbi:MAG: nucleotidyltransferase domain-containing protein [Pseudomonadota bacterium]|nr:MAG: nucleotidyltransferase domain-containing protein [Pseudomonadota bacterium]
MNLNGTIIAEVLDAYPRVQAVYLFGSTVDGEQRGDSDIDVAVLLPPEDARRVGSLLMGALHEQLESLLGRSVDLINLREVSTVFQNEIIASGQRIHCAHPDAADEFEMLVMSMYQKLNAERAGILSEGLGSGRFYRV